MSDELDIVDIHTHLWPAAWGADGSKRISTGLADAVLKKIVDPARLIDELSSAGVSLAVVSTTIESLFGMDKAADPAVISEVNDWLAGLVKRHPGSLAALATIDPFAGEAAAHEAERALGELGLAGLVVDSYRNGTFIGDPVARPALAVAARLGKPVFVHPVNAPQADLLIAGAGKLGNSLGRGLMNGVAFLSVLENGLLDAFPDLNFIFATLGLGAVVQAARGGHYSRQNRAAGHRPNIYFDTMGDDPSIIAILVQFFGADRVLAGTDWPILPALSRETLAQNLAAAGLGAEARSLVAGGNARRLLGRLDR
ncbi:aminocarboxymuconate-semialdehyde decarboxylase [Rhizobium sp. BK650]|uniref:amidohydrolase family protein n=1 Tax=Rhizobium sp. BK650 TaxID=2586990 RepID=UPI00161B31D3|nr:amidohydrolase family protein [Rhizobium sp. BK650]MBB3659884.1 aminocarboxymuconate-semialdehyde decarboxylase [Rhizobium sp. BK650]